MPFQPSFVNGFVQISAVCTGGTCYVVMERDFTSFALWNTVFRKKIPQFTALKGFDGGSCKDLSLLLYSTACVFYRIKSVKGILPA
ncbi:hypothetical protein YEP4_18584 [Yersinia enterocolitica subsp. palearctica YE-P4]|uniref:Uncharacterized protein n=2 Tax=Yersinia enterocolitica TaxID=630 RepID=A0ABM9S1Q6_YEREN|nr:hypothetical protein XM56_17010 [Yersinia enterocolitica]EHB22688.1 hypothetical protein IOK_01644 [Yersinia enterocolitica subsp. palearctica PhRBD_Ye1]EOR65320.1 hypothetical protein YE150_18621 [Yersinia enterocolitica subsp. palearctica YE-150]EOR65464.1 hypothetical protein YEP4_18584 [Yersinia enterocolitica subsp. palearctica YE-P4]EOR66259.1 hypothetical protein YE149_18678 [Yersinia enterocolitica subsp. palearctica YE-149]EOR73725.1 hypothetical protein YEP1_18670 [Yersinia entero